MSGISFVLNLAKNALYAQQQGINVTAHNIANVNTEGYSRQQINLESLSPDTSARVKLGLGVIADSVYQHYDRFVTQNLLQKESALREFETKSSTLNYIQGLFNDSAGNGLSQALNEFWNGWQDVADNPEGIPERTALLQKAEALAERFHTIRNDLGRIQVEVGNSLGASLNELNSLTGRVAELNQKIVASESSGTTANDLRDQRTELLKKISGLIEGTVYNNADGSTTFVTGSGLLLMDRAATWKLFLHGNEIWWNENTVDISSRLTGGKIGGQLDLRDEILPQYTANLDELAGTLIRGVNTLHDTAYTLDGSTGLAFFEPLADPVNNGGAAGLIRLSASLKDHPENVAAAQENLVIPPNPPEGLPGDNRMALQILALQTDETLSIKKWTYEDRQPNLPVTMTTSLDSFYRTLVGDMGTLTADSQTQYEFSQTMINNLNDLRESVSGVNLDEELTELMQLQSAYKAAAKLVSTSDELYQTILNMR